jgi:hypothetical protein
LSKGPSSRGLSDAFVEAQALVWNSAAPDLDEGLLLDDGPEMDFSQKASSFLF